MTGEVHYRPSFFFWFLLLILLFTWIGWVLPIIFYMTQKASVRTAVEKAFERVKNEFDQGSGHAAPAPSRAAELETLARLRDQGVLTEDEFQEQKRALLVK